MFFKNVLQVVYKCLTHMVRKVNNYAMHVPLTVLSNTKPTAPPTNMAVFSKTVNTRSSSSTPTMETGVFFKMAFNKLMTYIYMNQLFFSKYPIGYELMEPIRTYTLN